MPIMDGYQSAINVLKFYKIIRLKKYWREII